jgi:predicted Zn-dependent protease
LRPHGSASHARITKAYLNVFAVGDRGDEGYGGAAHRDISALDVNATIATAADRALRSSQPKRRLDPGPIEAILAPDAVEELMSWAGPIGFGGKMFVEGAGFSAGRIGDAMFDDVLTIHDDGLSDDPTAIRVPFDAEGVPKRRVTLVDRGRLVGIAHDTTTADLAGTTTTGHAAHDDVEAGPLPLHLFIEPGDASVAELMRGVERGLWITRFHYVNGYVNPREGAMTGLTRGGTFLIEHGRLTDPVETARFSDRFPAIFSSIARIGAERRLVPSWLHDAGGSIIPAIHVRSLNIT